MACRTPRPKRDLMRVVRAARTGDLAIDPRGKAPGRGAYLCRDEACVDRGLREGSLARALDTAIDEATRERLHAELGAAMTRPT